MTDERIIQKKIETREAQIARISYVWPSITMSDTGKKVLLCFSWWFALFFA